MFTYEALGKMILDFNLFKLLCIILRQQLSCYGGEC